MADKIGALIIDVEGQALTAEDREILAHPLVGGVILFTRNYATRAQLQQLVQAMREVRKQPLLIMVDQEGGRVQRFKNEFTRLPPAAVFGKLYDVEPMHASHLAKEAGWLMAAELLSIGIDFSLAPVLDVNKGVSSVIGDRAFHSCPETIVALSTAFVQGMSQAGMASIGKHFPGHGSVSADSHTDIPVDERTLETIAQDDMLPFARLVKNGLTAVMAAHIIYPHVDSMAVGFSRLWLQEILRKQLGFTGTVLSDDLNMKGADVSSNCADRVALARNAGCDFTLLCNNRRGVIQVLDNLSYTAHWVNKEKWGALQGKFSSTQQSLQKNARWLASHESLLALSS